MEYAEIALRRLNGEVKYYRVREIKAAHSNGLSLKFRRGGEDWYVTLTHADKYPYYWRRQALIFISRLYAVNEGNAQVVSMFGNNIVCLGSEYSILMRSNFGTKAFEGIKGASKSKAGGILMFVFAIAAVALLVKFALPFVQQQFGG